MKTKPIVTIGITHSNFYTEDELKSIKDEYKKLMDSDYCVVVYFNNLKVDKPIIDIYR